MSARSMVLHKSRIFLLIVFWRNCLRLRAIWWPFMRLVSTIACIAGAIFFSGNAAAQVGSPRTIGQRLADDLKWTQPEREDRFAHMDRLFPANRIRHGTHWSPLPAAKPLNLRIRDEDLSAFMEHDRLAGVLVLQNGRIRVERYGLGSGRRTRWTSFSVTKSITSTLVGAAIADGAIRSLDDAVTRYIPELQGSAYDGVTVRQLLTMTSGVRWIEDYTTPDSDNVRLYATTVSPGKDAVVEYMRRLPRESAPGAKWVYKTGETDLSGVLVRRATGKTLSAYLSEKVWIPFGMESDATWTAESGREFGGSGVSATLRDFGRFGEFVLRGGAGLVGLWFTEATRTQMATGVPGHGYGLQWWTYDDGSYAALGIFGQSILVDPARKLVIVTLGAWPQATSAALVGDRAALWRAVREAIDSEGR